MDQLGKKTSGFTLVELLVVIGIMLLIMGIGWGGVYSDRKAG